MAVATTGRLSYYVFVIAQLNRDSVGDFGNKFRKAREAKSLSFDDVSNVTKIGARMLQAIEDEHFDQLPGGVFNKGFIRAYAKHLGLNPEEAVTDYLACLRQAQVDAHEVWQPSPLPAEPSVTPKLVFSSASKASATRPSTANPVGKAQGPLQVEELPHLQLPRLEDIRPPRRPFSERQSGRIPWVGIAAAVLVVVAIFLFWSRRSHSAPAETAMASTKASPAQPAPAAAAPVAQPAVAPAPKRAQSSTVTKPSAAAPGPSNSQPATLAAAHTPVPASAQSPAPASAAPPSDTEESKNDVTVRTFSKSDTKAATTAAGSFALVIRATENSWISVLADGQLVTQETLIAPAQTSIHATREITVKVGNAAGISFLFNGNEIAAQGNESEVKTLTFDASGLKTTSSPQTAN